MWPDFPLFPKAASTVARDVDVLYLAWVGISFFFAALIAGAIIFFFMKYRRRRPRDIGTPVHGSIPLEIAWSVIPLILALVMFAWGASVFFTLRRAPADAVDYFATGKQWMWKFQHPTGVREINNLHIPVGQPIRLTMTSEDVIHSLYVPAFRVKQDVVPGRYSSIWFEATEPGEYHLFCAEYCGTEHSKMGGTVTVMAQPDYEAWLSAGGTDPVRLASGAELFERFACQTCHQTPGLEEAAPVPMAGRGPSLAGIFGREIELQNGRRVTADENYLRESILDPQASIVAGWQPIMPTYRGQMSEDQLLQLIHYIKGLSEGAVKAEVVAAPSASETSEAAEES